MLSGGLIRHRSDGASVVAMDCLVTVSFKKVREIVSLTGPLDYRSAVVTVVRSPMLSWTTVTVAGSAPSKPMVVS